MAPVKPTADHPPQTTIDMLSANLNKLEGGGDIVSVEDR
jgi:hypothetical protein